MSDYFTMMNGLGGLGLSGMYDPYMSMYGMNGMSGLGAYGGYGSYGMGMYNPTFMAQMTQMQQQMEKSQLQHSSEMHDLLAQYKVQNLSADERAFFESVAQDGGIKSNIEKLADSIRKGDQDQICVDYDTVKRNIYTKYSSYFRNNASKMDTEANVRGVIENLYSTIISQQAHETVDLKSDIRRYGETAFGHGFYKGLTTGIWGNGDDYHKRYTEETLDYIYKSGIDNKHGKDKMQKLGDWIGQGTRAIGIPAGVGLGAGLVAGALGGKGWAKGVGILAAIGAAGLDFLWQHS